ncbi:MAG: magnesium transporter [Pseudomonadota bacterium]
MAQNPTESRAPEEREADEIELLIKNGSDADIRDFLNLVKHPADLAEILDEIDDALWPRVLSNLPAEDAAELVAELDEATREVLFDLLKPREIAQLAVELESDDAADLIGELEPHEVDQVLAEIAKVDAEDAAEVRALMAYPEDSAGGIMQMELAALPVSATVDEAINLIRDVLEEETEDIHSVYVLDEQGIYLGNVPLARLVVSRRGTRLGDIMEAKVASVRPEVDQEEVLNLFRKYDLLSLAVIDAQGKLLGRIVHDDVMDVAHEEADEDALRMAGTSAEELVYGNRVFRIAGVRLPWLITNLIGGLIAGYFLWLFRVMLADAVALIAFIPVINGMAGNVGTQSSTIVTRGFATGRIEMEDIWHTLLKEIAVGVLMGLACGTVVGLVAGTTLWGGSSVIGIAVGISMTVAMIFASMVGTLAPAALKRLGIDPAIAASPFVSTSNDITGILIFMTCSMLVLHLGD